MTGARAQAVALLRKALDLKADWLQSDVHPGLLEELCDLHAVLDDPTALSQVSGMEGNNHVRSCRTALLHCFRVR